MPNGLFEDRKHAQVFEVQKVQSERLVAMHLKFSLPSTAILIRKVLSQIANSRIRHC